MPSRTSRHRAISSLRAKATIMGFRVPRAFSVRDRNHFVKALFFWCRRNRHPMGASRVQVLQRSRASSRITGRRAI
jgi:hypothetical protein